MTTDSNAPAIGILRSSSSLRGHYAGFVTRLIAFAIDLFIIVTGQLLFVMFARLALDFFGLDQLARDVFDPTGAAESTFIFVFRWAIAIVSSGLVFAVYVVVFWLLAEKTLGQGLLGLRVVRTDGRHITLLPAVKRVLGYYLSFFALSLGFLWILIDDRRQGWHDKIADTVVVYDWDARIGWRLREWLARRQNQPPQ
ncbi:MAG: RDD family protein [Anaerolineae bacterium]|nr:RDD family protein [Anaerolineae bacterium]HNS40793.1 RDD family protein [Promineifilum sp.]